MKAKIVPKKIFKYLKNNERIILTYQNFAVHLQCQTKMEICALT